MPIYGKSFFISDIVEILPRSKVERDMNTTPVFLAIIIAGISMIKFIEGKSVSTGKFSVREKYDRYNGKRFNCKYLIKRKFIVSIILRVGNETTTATEITESATQEAVTEDDPGNSTGIATISITVIYCMA